MNECSGFMGHFFGHKYKARYDTSMPGGWTLEHGNVDIVKAFRKIVYRGDVCQRCGDIVNNETTT